MRIIHFVLMTILAALALSPAAAQSLPAGEQHVSARLVAETATPEPGASLAIAFVMRPEQGWHGYWENPGDAGKGMTLKWRLPSGVTAGPLRYPVPETLIISGLMNYVYEGPYALLSSLKIPATIKPGTPLAIRVRADWLACTDKICVPEGGDLALDLMVGGGAIGAGRDKAFDSYRERLPRPLGAEGRFESNGKRLRLAIPFPAAAKISKPYFFPLTENAARYSSPQSITRNGDWLIVETDAGGPAPRELRGLIKTGDHNGLLLTARYGEVPRAGTPVGGREGSSGLSVSAIVIVLGSALLGGLVLNIMPCVFPILSLKALKLAKAGGDQRMVRRDALAYMAGAVLTCLVLGGLLLALRAGGAAVGWAFQLQDPRIILLLLVLVTAIALNLAGLFDLGSVGAGGSFAEKSGAAGSFWTGALAAFVATPCTGPFMGAALGAALVLPAVMALGIFAGLGLGLALPFLLIAFIPALRTRLPRPGAWMNTLRHILSVPMFATALALAWLLGRQAGTPGMSIGIGVALAAGLLFWWIGARQAKGKGGALPLGLGVLALIAGGAALIPMGQTPASAEARQTDGPGQPFSEARLAALRSAGRPVFLYFTADWCITCKVNEAAAIDTVQVREAFARGNVEMLVGDWTNADPEISRFLERHGRSGVPLYIWYAPGKEARILPQILTPAYLASLSGI